MPVEFYTSIISMGILVGLLLLIHIIFDRFRIPFNYPKIQYKINISRRREPSYEDCIDQWIINNQNINIIDTFNKMLSDWDNKSQKYLKRTLFWKKHKTGLYNKMRQQIIGEDYCSFEFIFFRIQTRYKQVNYQKYPYQVQNTEHVEALTLKDILSINNILDDIGYETTREKYYAKNQRKLMTKELRRKIIRRDNYTCQICGKYMPDEVGLHVDHIIAIKNGGKTVESNLQVLCDKCNLSKGSKNCVKISY